MLFPTTLFLKLFDVLVKLIQVLTLDAELLFEFPQAVYTISMRDDSPAFRVLPLHLLLPDKLVLCSSLSFCEGITGWKETPSDSGYTNGEEAMSISCCSYKLTLVLVRQILCSRYLLLQLGVLLLKMGAAPVWCWCEPL
jgi:hypothetical protein